VTVGLKSFIRLEARLQPNIGFTIRRVLVGGAHAFGYNSAESESTLMKSGALWFIFTAIIDGYKFSVKV